MLAFLIHRRITARRRRGSPPGCPSSTPTTRCASPTSRPPCRALSPRCVLCAAAPPDMPRCCSAAAAMLAAAFCACCCFACCCCACCCFACCCCACCCCRAALPTCSAALSACCASGPPRPNLRPHAALTTRRAEPSLATVWLAAVCIMWLEMGLSQAFLAPLYCRPQLDQKRLPTCNLPRNKATNQPTPAGLVPPLACRSWTRSGS